jgi:hypothetical protein
MKYEYETYQSERQAKRGDDLIEQLFVDCPRLARAHGRQVSPDQVGTTIPLEIISDLLCPAAGCSHRSARFGY